MWVSQKLEKMKLKRRKKELISANLFWGFESRRSEWQPPEANEGIGCLLVELELKTHI